MSTIKDTYDDRSSSTSRNNKYSEDDSRKTWQNIEKSYRLKYPMLTDEDTDQARGNYNEMTERIGTRTKRSGQEVRQEIDNWDNSNRENS